MIKDASYQGINLLNNGNLTITLNENRSHKFTVDGVDARYETMGINTLEWKYASDVEQALKEIQDAINKMRDYSSMFGNSYQVIQTRQNFTSALIDVLETGSDNLVLADMNEESANYLALQTRQQLATNSLSLASQSAQSVLSLF
jgi:flagellin-like hook-associated protein FlgL